eukprot:3400701-Pyramimonas_sp.AAC.1
MRWPSRISHSSTRRTGVTDGGSFGKQSGRTVTELREMLNLPHIWVIQSVTRNFGDRPQPRWLEGDETSTAL